MELKLRFLIRIIDDVALPRLAKGRGYFRMVFRPSHINIRGLPGSVDKIEGMAGSSRSILYELLPILRHLHRSVKELKREK